MHRQSPTRAVARSTPALANFHLAACHPGDAEGCPDCAEQVERQRQAEAALRAHRRATRKQVDRILGRSS